MTTLKRAFSSSSTICFEGVSCPAIWSRLKSSFHNMPRRRGLGPGFRVVARVPCSGDEASGFGVRLHFAQEELGIRSQNNRRLLALRAFQSTRLDECIMVHLGFHVSTQVCSVAVVVVVIASTVAVVLVIVAVVVVVVVAAGVVVVVVAVVVDMISLAVGLLLRRRGQRRLRLSLILTASAAAATCYYYHCH